MKGIILGFGNMGQTHYDRYNKLDITIVAVIDVDPNKLKLAQSYGLRTYVDIKQVQNVENIDFIDICTPTNFHFSNLMECIKYEKPIFIEKPVVRTLQEVEKLRKIENLPLVFVGEVEQYNLQLSPFLNYSGNLTLIEISREINLDFFLKGTKSWFLDNELSGGIILDAMIHDINMLVMKYGKPDVISVIGKSSGKYGCLDEVEAILQFRDFKTKLHCSWNSTRTDTPVVTLIKIYNEKGKTIEVACDNYIIREKSQNKEAFYLEIEAFIKAVKTGKVPYSFLVYLDAIEVAYDIIYKI